MYGAARWQRALALASQSLGALEAAKGPQSAEVAVALHAKCRVLAQLGRRAEAAAVCQQAIAILRWTRGNDHPALTMALHHLVRSPHAARPDS